MTKSEKINLISTILLIGFAIGIYYHFVVMGFYVGKSYPFNSFLHNPAIVFSDIHDEVFNTKDLHPYQLAPSERHTISVYFPFAFIFIYPFSLISVKTTFIIFLLTFIGTLVAANYYFLKEENTDKVSLLRNVFIFSFLTFPFLFEIDRANIESFVFIFSVIFLLLYQRKKTYLAAIFLSFATAMKIYPGVLFFLLLKDKKYKEFIFGAFFTLAISLISLAMMRGSFVDNFHGLISESNTGKLFFGTTIAPIGIVQSSTLFGLIKIFIILLNLDLMNHLDKVFMYFSVLTIFVGIGLYFYLMRENDLWKIVLILTCCTLLFNYVSFAYRMIHLFIPLWLFLNHKEKSKYDLQYCFLFALLLIPMGYRIFPHAMHGSYDIAAVLNPLLMISLIVLIIKENLISIRNNDKK